MMPELAGVVTSRRFSASVPAAFPRWRFPSRRFPRWSFPCDSNHCPSPRRRKSPPRCSSPTAAAVPRPTAIWSIWLSPSAVARTTRSSKSPTSSWPSRRSRSEPDVASSREPLACCCSPTSFRPERTWSRTWSEFAQDLAIRISRGAIRPLPAALDASSADRDRGRATEGSRAAVIRPPPSRWRVSEAGGFCPPGADAPGSEAHVRACPTRTAPKRRAPEIRGGCGSWINRSHWVRAPAL